MNKIAFLLSGLLGLLGLITIVTTRIIAKIMPAIGYAAFQQAAAGSFNAQNYYINFREVNLMAIISMVISILLMITFYMKEKRNLSK